MIRPIDAWSVDQITSGQVVTSLSTSVKELLENSLDAGATVIDIKMINHGRDGFSVSDNGHGIQLEDFDFIAKKHATSKIHGFEDLSRIKTLGFRGEALASLCALADVIIVTNPDTAGSGYELTLNHSGEVVCSKKIASPRGTIVHVSKLFEQLPVRRKTFERGSAREFTKTIELVQDYALFSPARITLEHISKNRSNLTLKSHGSQLIQRIACIYGAKRTKSLQQVKESCSSSQISGYISQPIFGMGDSAPTCQLLAINDRPIQHSRLQKTIIEVYKQFNLNEQPFFVFNFQMNPDLYDVNVSPDKRTLLLHNEDVLISELRELLESFFSGSEHSVPRASQQVSYPPPKRTKQSLVSFTAFASSGTVIDQSYKNKKRQEETLPQVSSDSENLEHEASGIDTENEDIQENVQDGIQDDIQDDIHNDVQNEALDEDDYMDGIESNLGTLCDSQPFSNSGVSTTAPDDVENDQMQEHENAHIVQNLAKDPIVDRSRVANVDENSHEPEQITPISPQRIPLKSAGNSPRKHAQKTAHVKSSKTTQSVSVNSQKLKTLNTHIHLPLSSSIVEKAVEDASKLHEKSVKRLQTLAIDEQDAEERLQLSIRKQDFEKMDVVGQFNLGFILVVNRTNSHDDLFVIDQHASDEIYNFERLKSSTVLSRQPLVVPRVLELSAAEELTIQEHLSIFENNGFSIQIKADNPPGHQCVLVSVPFSKSTIFDEKDVLELLGKLKEYPNQPDLRCSKLRAMFAMRACRSSIMIGTPLSLGTMETVVRHMGTLDKPWNCPHGRPTLRHITTLS